MRLRVTEGFRPGFFDGLSPRLILRPGDHVTVDLDETSAAWPAFVRVTNDAGVNGWVPRRFLSGSGPERTALRPYDTSTLDPARGEVLEVVETDVESGWLWCRDPQGRTGWFPIRQLAPARAGSVEGPRDTP